MSDTAIQVQGLSKRYRIGKREGYKTLRESLMGGITGPLRRLRGRAAEEAIADGPDSFWALKDVEFKINRGEVVGVIGRNGAGKSTLLKILSRITEPTTGRVEIHGRVGSLLEVGTGFHPELTGRENVYLNGAILGMKRTEITSKFDEIVAFAEIEKFLDTPVKHYSSGMYMRLAFAVAAHLESEVLIVDEVLAVGDAEFQAKCLRKMKDVASVGRTVLFVSHNMSAVEMLTERTILMNGGRVGLIGDSSTVVQKYLAGDRVATSSLEEWRSRGTGSQRLLSVDVIGANGSATRTLKPLEPIKLRFEVESKDRNAWQIAFAIEDRSSTPLFAAHLTDQLDVQIIEGRCVVEVECPTNFLRHGGYLLSAGIYSKDTHVCYDEILHFPIFEINGYMPGVPTDSRWGTFFFPCEWKVSSEGRGE